VVLSIAVMQRKGGAGKTTLATHLAVALAQQNYRVQGFDTDPQGSFLAWYNVRQQRGLATAGLNIEKSGTGRISVDVRSARREADIVISDHPPHADTAAGPAIRTADLVLIPCQLSLPDVLALQSMVHAVERERVPYLVVLNRVLPQNKAADGLRAQLAQQYTLAQGGLGNRVAFMSALLNGLGVTEEQPHSIAAQEITQLLPQVLAYDVVGA
jgi:chromosome partitioning protein